MALDLKSALAFQDELRRLLAAIPTRGASRPTEEEDRQRAIALNRTVAAVAAKGGTLSDRWDGARINLYGLRASSTTGIVGACQNWLAQLTVKAMAAAMTGAR
jgi:hypothetical protein